jgi:hypothetical protein
MPIKNIPHRLLPKQNEFWRIKMDHSVISKEYLEEVQRRCDRATSGPWISLIEGRDHTSGDSVIIRGLNGVEEDLYLSGGSSSDQDFIAHARQDIPMLLREIERLRGIIEEKE